MLGAALALSAAGSAGAAPRSTSVPDLHAAPWRLAHRPVRLRGQIDACAGLSCKLCPETMTRETQNSRECLGIAFDDFADPVAGYATHRSMDEAFRFATVTVDAVFEPGCLTGTEDGRPHRNTGEVPVIICMDRATSLRQARVVRIHGRKTINDGLSFWGHDDELVRASGAEEAQMLGAWREAMPPGEEEGRPAAFKVVEAPDPDTGVIGLVCLCVRGDDCEGRWPVRWGSGFLSPANPFVCNYVVKRDGRWRAAY
jgi:hypothetical protein